MAMSDVYRFIDPTNNNEWFETYSTNYVSDQIVTLNNNITTNNQMILNQVSQEIVNVNNAMTTLSTNLTNAMNTLNTNLTQYVDNSVQTVATDLVNLTAVVNQITDGSGNLDVTNIMSEFLTIYQQLTLDNSTLTLNNSSIVYDYNTPGDIVNVRNITFNSGVAGVLDMSGGTIINLGTPVNPNDAVTKAYVDAQTGAYLPLTGGMLTGNLTILNGGLYMAAGAVNLAGNDLQNGQNGWIKKLYVNELTANTGNTISFSGMNVTSMADPLYAQDAATKNYVDTSIDNALGGGSGNATFTNLTVTNLATVPTPVNATDAANKDYVDQRVATGGGAFLPINGSAPMAGTLTVPGPYALQTYNIFQPVANSTLSINHDKVNLVGANTTLTGLRMATTPASFDATNVQYVSDQIAEVENSINTTIKNLIPSDATSTNTLITQETLDDAIQNTVARQLTANAGGDPFATRAALNAGPYYFQGATTTPTTHDFAIVVADESAPAPFTGGQTRHAWDGTVWAYSFGLNEEPFTVAQTNAINSGITSTAVTQIQTNANAILNLISVLNPSAVAAQAALPLAGGTMSGGINMNSQALTNLLSPTNNEDAATKAYADTKLALTGGTMTGQISLPTGPAAANAVRKDYVDARSFTSVTLTTTDPGVGSTLANGAIVLVYTN